GPAVQALERLAHFLYAQAARVVVVTESVCRAAGRGGRSTQQAGGHSERRGHAPVVASRRRRHLSCGIRDGRFVVAYIGSHGLSHGLGAVLAAAAAQPEVTYLLVVADRGGCVPGAPARRAAVRGLRGHEGV